MSLPNITKPADGLGRALTLVEKPNPLAKAPGTGVAAVKEQQLPSRPPVGLAYELEDERLPSVSSF